MRWGDSVVMIWAAGVATAGCGSEAEQVVIPERPSYREWIKVEPEGAVCGNGSQFKFWVNYSDVSNNVVVAFEPGGACWDYPSCSGADGIRGAANPDGIPDDHIDVVPFLVPHFQRDYEDTITRDWNYVYVPYCTGDVHTGNRVAEYTGDDGETLEFHHTGHDNTMAVIEYMQQEFQRVPKLFVTGCSAGGVGSLVNYYWLRKNLPGVDRGYLLDDSGPIFPRSENSAPMYDKIRESWNVDSITDGLPAGFDPNDFGSINEVLANEFPDDRLAVTFFRRDYNFSLYSYERFYDYPDKETIHEMFWEDTQLLVDQFDARDNLAYYIPYWRLLNDSHCTALITFSGSEIQEHDVGLGDFIGDLLDDDAPLQSYLESVQPDEDLPEGEGGEQP